ncbi:MAG: hypothetical protein ACFBRM_15520 [Pikeienuella sp.]
MRTEPPISPRAHVSDRPDALEITIPARREPLVVLFIGFWLCGWAAGWLTVAGTALKTLVADGLAGLSLFTLAWLGGWTVGGLFAGAVLLWQLAGREVIRVTADGLVLSREIPGYRRLRAYAGSYISDLRARPATAVWPLAKGQLGGLFAGSDRGMITFDYGEGSVAFAVEIDAREAERLVDRITAWVATHRAGDADRSVG